jgi:ABC-type Na+ efflux pump permease subunit
MNRNVLLIAMREFRQIARTRSFWLTLLILPISFALAPLITRVVKPDFQQSVMLIDRSTTGAGKAIAARIELETQRANLSTLADFAKDNRLEKLAGNAAWGHKLDWYPDGLVAKFVAEGGAEPALKAIRASSPKLAESLTLPKPAYSIVPTPDDLARLAPDELDGALAPYLRPAKDSGRKAIDYVLAIPADFGAQPAVRLWTSGQPRQPFMGMIQGELTRTLRAGFLQTQGVAPPVAQIANQLEPAIAITRPKEVGGREKLLVQSILPVAMAYILLMSLIMSGQWMLQSTIEERSSKLIEAVLACASPNEFMHGKLIGTIAIGLVMIATWVACGLFAAFATQGVIADFIRPALEPLQSFGSVATILYFFLTGYVMVALIFLVIGAMSDSMQDAQGFLVPVILVLMFPVIILMQAVISGSDSIFAHVLTWIPLFTPFAVLARLGTGIPTYEIIGSGIVLLAFIALEFVMLGRVFRAAILSGTGRPNFRTIARMMRK